MKIFLEGEYRRRRGGPRLLLLAAALVLAARAPSQSSSSSSPSSSSSFSQSPSPTPIPSVSLPPDLDRVLRDYEKAWAARDATGLAALFAEDGFVLQGGKPPVRGRAAIRAAYEGHGGPLSLRALAFGAEGGTGFILGGYAGKAGDADDGKFTLTLRKGTDGRWMIFSDMDNGNRPPKKQP
jgi:ketosteroid isomerase-like protein